jgi:hypothetical protein
LLRANNVSSGDADRRRFDPFVHSEFDEPEETFSNTTSLGWTGEWQDAGFGAPRHRFVLGLMRDCLDLVV